MGFFTAGFPRAFMGFFSAGFCGGFVPEIYRVFAAGCAAENRASIARAGCGGFSPNICGVFAAGRAATFPRDSMGFCARGGRRIFSGNSPYFFGHSRAGFPWVATSIARYTKRRWAASFYLSP